MTRRRRNSRKRNLSDRGKLTLGIVGGVAAGGLVAYLVVRSRYGQRAMIAAHEWSDTSGVRLPDPSYAVELPSTAEQFATLDELVCECGHLATPQAVATDEELVVTGVRDCVLAKLYPDFPWPPIPGDHPTVARLFSEVEVIARRAVAEDRVCPSNQAGGYPP